MQEQIPTNGLVPAAKRKEKQATCLPQCAKEKRSQ